MFLSRYRFAVASLLCCIFVLTVATVQAAERAPTTRLTLHDAIAATLVHNPQLGAFEFQARALTGEKQTAGLRPALQLSSTVENVAGSGDFRGIEGAELTLALSSVIELGGKRDARLNLVTTRQEALATQQRIVELDLLAEVTERFIEAAATEQEVTLLQSALDLATETAQAIKRRVEMGNTPEAELARAQASQSRRLIQLKEVQANFEAAKIKLSAMWGEPDPQFLGISANLMELGNTPDSRQLLAGLKSNPDVLQFANEARLRDAELRLAKSQGSTDVAWSAGVRRLQASKDSALVVGVSIPLFTENRAMGETVTAQANRDSINNARETALLQWRAQLLSLSKAREQAVFEVTTLTRDVIPPLKKAVSGTRNAFEKGRYGYLELASAQTELLDAEVALIEAAQRAHVLRTEIERLSGSSTTQVDAH